MDTELEEIKAEVLRSEDAFIETEDLNTHRLSLEGLLKVATSKKGIVYFRSGSNHPWHISNSFFFDKDVKKKRTPRTITNDCDHTERNMRWWNDYRPPHYSKVQLCLAQETDADWEA